MQCTMKPSYHTYQVVNCYFRALDMHHIISAMDAQVTSVISMHPRTWFRTVIECRVSKSMQTFEQDPAPTLWQVAGCRCILLAEQVLQDIGFGHTDIRWGNIIRLPTKFVLIDLEFACELGHVPFTPLGTLSAC